MGACNLGTDPEAWRKAMREWMANGNKPGAPHFDRRRIVEVHDGDGSMWR